MPRASKKKRRIPRHSEEKRVTKYPYKYGLDLSLPIGDRDDVESDPIISEFNKLYNQTEENYHE